MGEGSGRPSPFEVINRMVTGRLQELYWTKGGKFCTPLVLVNMLLYCSIQEKKKSCALAKYLITQFF